MINATRLRKLNPVEHLKSPIMPTKYNHDETAIFDCSILICKEHIAIMAQQTLLESEKRASYGVCSVV